MASKALTNGGYNARVDASTGGIDIDGNARDINTGIATCK